MEQQLQFDRNRRRAEYCPCGKSNKDGKFSPFKGYVSKGHCHSCGQTFLLDLGEKDMFPVKQNFKPYLTKEKPSFIDYTIFKKTLTSYNVNYFVLFLKSVFRSDLVDDAVIKYNIGTSKHWSGSTIFWQLDELSNVRTGKVMLYDQVSGKRVKKPFDHITWVHALTKIPDFKLSQVLFGSHLVKPSTKVVAIVESEKTAIIASICFQDFTWLATGSKTGLKVENLTFLKNKKIILYPDANGFEQWTNFAQRNKNDFNFRVSDLLNRSLSDENKQNGEDIADFLLTAIPDWLKASYILNEPSGCNDYSKSETRLNDFISKNQKMSLITSILSLVPESDPSSDTEWQNDFTFIRKVEQEIVPETTYHIDEIKVLIKKHYSAFNINFENIINELVDKNVIVRNTLNKDYYYRYDSTPF
ncbi:MAG: hypothetical protein KA341_01650 [Saprospiraceae bacterium]|nr:hypothetical protein [Saprospiraceae bacterium]